MSDITLSVLGMYNEYPDLFSGLTVPEDVDTANLITIICAESAELEVLYPEPVTMRTIITAWSAARLPSWERMLDALTEEYDPLHNYNRHETETVDDEESETEERSTSRTESGTTGETGSGSRNGTDVTTGQLTGFNSNTFADDRKTSGTTAITESSQKSGTRSGTENASDDVERNRENSRSRSYHAYGNIGVTTSMQMLLEELKARKTDIYQIITDEFINYFCLPVY